VAERLLGTRITIENSDARVQLRPALLSDVILLRGLQRRCFAGSQAYGLVTLLVLYFWARSHIIVASAGERIVGCAVGDSDRGQTRVLNLCVDPEFRRLGIASALLTGIEDHFGDAYVTLMVEDKNIGAQALYRLHGYLPVSDLRNYYGRNRHGILMQLHRMPKTTPPETLSSVR
jgi:ribosomal-protein-alanine N-acetyltransferase